LLASIARLRFTGNVRIALDSGVAEKLSLNGNCVFSFLSQPRGAPHLSALICVVLKTISRTSDVNRLDFH